jgi:son of sevenless
VYLTDLTFIDENADGVNGLINFAKRKMIYNVISKIIQYQQTHYNLQPIDQIIQQLLKVPILDETTLYNLSLKREPRKAERHEIE